MAKSNGFYKSPGAAWKFKVFAGHCRVHGFKSLVRIVHLNFDQNIRFVRPDDGKVINGLVKRCTPKSVYVEAYENFESVLHHIRGDMIREVFGAH